jgi:ferredoxin
MKVTVDSLLCEANGLCVLAAPEVFEMFDDDDGGGVQILKETPPAALEDAVREAVDACPKQALRIVKE